MAWILAHYTKGAGGLMKRKNADEQDDIADYDTAQGLPRGDVGSFRKRAAAWREVAKELEAEAEGMK